MQFGVVSLRGSFVLVVRHRRASLSEIVHRTTRATYRIQAVIQFLVRVSPVSGETLGGGIAKNRLSFIAPQWTKVEQIEREVEALSTMEELAAFRSWFVEREWQAWDRELERDVTEGRLDRFAAEALAEFERGETTEL